MRLVVVMVFSAALLACSSTFASSSLAPVEETLQDFKWRSVGPLRGGRVNAVVGHPEDRLVFFAGYSGGGIWKTEDGGSNWKNVSDGQVHKGSIGALAISSSNPEILFAGTGEQALRGDVSHGDGVYRSTDGGETWTNVGLTDTRQISQIIIHPNDSDIVYVAAIGHFAGPNKQRGVFRSVDGGDTWEQLLFVNEHTGAISLSIDKRDPDVLFASMWDMRRFPWGIRSAGANGGLYRSKDGGETWTNISNNAGLPGGLWERSAVSVSQSAKGLVWALLSTSEGEGLYRSENYGESWAQMSSDPRLTGRTYYFMKMIADTQDPDTVYVLNYDFLKSADGGRTFTAIPTGHADHHAVWIDAKDNQRIIDGSDGGAQVTFNGGETWSSLYNQPTGQFYSLTTDDSFPYNLYGAQQDWSTLIVPSLQRRARLPSAEVHDVAYSEAGRVAIDQKDPSILYISDHHWLLRYDRNSHSIQYVGPRDETNYGWGTRDIKLRFNWVFPVFASVHDSSVLYAGSQYLHRSKDGGQTWETLGPDLTLADPETLELTPLPGRETSSNEKYWGPVTRDSNGDHWFGTLYVIAESRIQENLIWTGSDDGVVNVTRDGGKTWRVSTPKGLPKHAMITGIDPSPFDPAVAYLSASAYKLNDYQPLLYKTEDYGKSWRKIIRGIDDNEIMRVVRADPVDKDLVFAGSETGVYVSNDAGKTWQRLQFNLPAVPVYDMQIKSSDLVIATHGRGFWILDDISVLRQLDQQVLREPFHLFEPRAAVRVAGRWGKNNPPFGAVIYYHLKESTNDIELLIKDSNGQVVDRFSQRLSRNVGLNKFVWNLRYPNATCAPGIVTRGSKQVGPRAVPGIYQAELSVNGVMRRAEFEVVIDPRVQASRDDLVAQFEFLSQVRTKISEVNQAFIDIRSLQASLHSSISESSHGDLLQQAKQIENDLRLLEQELVQPKAKYRKDLHALPVKVNDKFYRLANFVDRANARPTQAKHDMFRDFSEWSDRTLEAFDNLLNQEVADYNRLARELGVAEITQLNTVEGSCGS